MQQEGEPSVDEILTSIKKVMERGNQMQASNKPRKRAGLVATDDESNDDILDLGVIGAAISEDAPKDPWIEDAADEDLEAEAEAEAKVQDQAGSAEQLTNDEAANAMRQSLAALSMLSEPPAKPQIVRQGETSLEGMAREMLRPMLAQWLDANLPDIVERMVKAEIARIAGKKR